MTVVPVPDDASTRFLPRTWDHAPVSVTVKSCANYRMIVEPDTRTRWIHLEVAVVAGGNDSYPNVRCYPQRSRQTLPFVICRRHPVSRRLELIGSVPKAYKQILIFRRQTSITSFPFLKILTTVPASLLYLLSVFYLFLSTAMVQGPEAAELVG